MYLFGTPLQHIPTSILATNLTETLLAFRVDPFIKDWLRRPAIRNSHLTPLHDVQIEFVKNRAPHDSAFSRPGD